MQKQRRKYDRVQSCSSQSVCTSDAAVESTYVSTDNTLSRTEETGARSTIVNPTFGDMNSMPSNAAKMSSCNARTNRRRNRRRKQNINKKLKQTFRNTVVLAPFHSLKLCFQNKLKDLYRKGTLENKAKKLKIPNNSLFQYEVMEMKAGQLDTRSLEKKANEKKSSTSNEKETNSKKRKYDGFDSNEYCHCFRNGKKNLQGKQFVTDNAEGTSTSFSADIEGSNESNFGPQAPKRMRKDDSDHVEPAAGADNEGRRTVMLKDLQQNSSNNETIKGKVGSNKEETTNNRKPFKNEGKSLIRKSGRFSCQISSEFKYRTRSVTRKENIRSANCPESGDACLAYAEERRNDTINSTRSRHSTSAAEKKADTNSLEHIKTSEKTVKDDLENTAAKDSNLNIIRSDVSVLFLEEIATDANKRTQDVVASMENLGDRSIQEEVSNIADKCTCSNVYEQKPEETPPSVSEVTQMFHTLLNKPNYETTNTNCSDAAVDNENHFEINKYKSPTLKSRRDGNKSGSISDCCVEEQSDAGSKDEQRELEPLIIVQEIPNESSSSDRISDTSRNIKNPESNIAMGTFVGIPNSTHGVTERSSYIFGQKSQFHHARGSCEYEFGMSHSLSDDDVDDCESRGNSEFENNR